MIRPHPLGRPRPRPERPANDLGAVVDPPPARRRRRYLHRETVRAIVPGDPTVRRDLGQLMLGLRCRSRLLAWDDPRRYPTRRGPLTGAYADIMVALGRLQGAGGHLCVSRETLAEEAGCSVPTVQRALPVLEMLGAVEVLRRWAEGREVRPGVWRGRSANVYRLRWPPDLTAWIVEFDRRMAGRRRERRRRYRKLKPWDRRPARHRPRRPKDRSGPEPSPSKTPTGDSNWQGQGFRVRARGAALPPCWAGTATSPATHRFRRSRSIGRPGWPSTGWRAPGCRSGPP